MLETRSRRSQIALQVIATLFILPYVYPLVAMVRGSFAGEGWGNYEAVLSVPGVPLFFRNSLLIAGVTVILVYLAAMTAAFGFSKLRIRRKEVWFWMILAALTLPEVVLLTPLFATVTALGVYDTFLAVVIPLTALQIPFAILLARNFVDGVPDELVDAARVDGAGSLMVFRHVIIPLTRPIGAAIVVMAFIAAWNDYLLPLLFLQSPADQTVTLLPQFFVGQYNDDRTKVLASAVVAAVPAVVAYVLLQRTFERGLAAGALK